MSAWTHHGGGVKLPTADDVGELVILTTKEVHRARLAVCASAQNAIDAALLMHALGIGPVDGAYRLSAALETMAADTTAVGPGSVAAPNRGLADRLDTTD